MGGRASLVFASLGLALALGGAGCASSSAGRAEPMEAESGGAGGEGAPAPESAAPTLTDESAPTAAPSAFTDEEAASESPDAEPDPYATLVELSADERLRVSLEDCATARALVTRICALAERVCELDGGLGPRCEDARGRCASSRDRVHVACP